MANFSFHTPVMELNMKLLQSPEGNHLIIIARGPIGVEALEQILRRAAETTQPLLNCKVLIDFEAANVRLKASDVPALVDGFGIDAWSHDIKIALVSPPEIDKSVQLGVLSDLLCCQGLRVALFDNARGAVNWLLVNGI